MNIVELIHKKKRNLEFSYDEIDFIVSGYNKYLFKKYEIDSLMMSMALSGLSHDECFYFAKILSSYAKVTDFQDVSGIIVGKNSTAGYSDVISLIIVPILASLGFCVPKPSFLGYGENIGSLDRLKLFSGYNTKLSDNNLINILNNVSASVFAVSDSVIAFDFLLNEYIKKNGVEHSIQFLAISAMSKKLLFPLDVLVLDIRCGEGSIIPTIELGTELGNLMLDIARRAGIKTNGMVTFTSEPIDSCCGIALELYEAIKFLKADKSVLSGEIYRVTREIVASVLLLSEKAGGKNDAYELFDNVLFNGEALKKFHDIIIAHGGDDYYLTNEDMLLQNAFVTYITAEKKGYMCDVNTMSLHQCVDVMGGGKDANGEIIDKFVGVKLLVREGDKVKEGQKLAKIYYSMDNPKFASGIRAIREAFTISKKKQKIESVVQKILI